MKETVASILTIVACFWAIHLMTKGPEKRFETSFIIEQTHLGGFKDTVPGFIRTVDSMSYHIHFESATKSEPQGRFMIYDDYSHDNYLNKLYLLPSVIKVRFLQIKSTRLP